MNSLKSIVHLATLIAVFWAINYISTNLPVQTTVFQEIEIYAKAMTYIIATYCAARAVEQLAGR